MELLSLLLHKSPFGLKERVRTSRTYVRPVQRDLDITPMDESDEETVSVHVPKYEVLPSHPIRPYLCML